MKKIVVVLMSMLAMLVAACGGSNAEAISTDNGGKIMQSENKTNSSKALVVYYSRSGNTEALARMIGNETGADMFRVIFDAADTVEREKRPGVGDLTVQPEIGRAHV